MAYYPSCCDTIQENDCDVCVNELARVRAVAFVHKSFYSALMAGLDNVTTWSLGRSQGNIFMYPETQGEYDGGSAITTRGFMSAQEQPVAMKFGIEFKEPNYIGNRNHWNSLFGNRNFYCFWITETIMYSSTRAVVITPKNPIANDLKQTIVWEASINWVDNQFPNENDIPTDAWQCQYDLIPPPYFSFDESFDNSFDAPDI